jgi:hypothetical protein
VRAPPLLLIVGRRPEVIVWGRAIFVERNDKRTAVRFLSGGSHVPDLERWHGFLRLSVFHDDSPLYLEELGSADQEYACHGPKALVQCDTPVRLSSGSPC